MLLIVSAPVTRTLTFLVLCFMHPMLHYGGLGIFSSFSYLPLYFLILLEQRAHVSELDIGGRTETWTQLIFFPGYVAKLSSIELQGREGGPPLRRLSAFS